MIGVCGCAGAGQHGYHFLPRGGLHQRGGRHDDGAFRPLDEDDVPRPLRPRPRPEGADARNRCYLLKALKQPGTASDPKALTTRYTGMGNVPKFSLYVSHIYVCIEMTLKNSIINYPRMNVRIRALIFRDINRT